MYFWILSYVFSLIVGADMSLYLILAPGRSVPVSLMLILLFVLLEIVFFRSCRHPSEYKWKLIRIERNLILLYLLAIVVLSSITNQPELGRWYRTKALLKGIKEAMILHHKPGQTLQESFTAVCNQRCRDPYQIDKDFSFRLLSHNRCLIYSVGPDRVDDNAETVLEDYAIKFSPNVSPWFFMFFKRYIIKLSGFDKKLKGDIVEVVEIAE